MLNKKQKKEYSNMLWERMFRHTKRKKIKGGPENRSSRDWRPRLCSDGAGSYTGINDTYIVSIIHNSVNDTWTRLRLHAKASSVAAVCILPIYYVEPIINIIPTQIIMF